jgi:hypothetical protein
VAAVLVLAPPILPAAGWLMQLPGIVTGAVAVLFSLVFAYVFGSTLWPRRGRWFAPAWSAVTLVAMVAAGLAAGDLTLMLPAGAVQESYTWGLWVPLCAPQQTVGFVYPALAGVGAYAAGAIAVVRWPVFWPMVGAAAVIAFQIGGNLAQGAGATWFC